MSRRTVLAARAASVGIAACAIASPAVSTAAPVPVELRVEAAGRALDRGTTYITDTARVKTDRRAACQGSGRTIRASGPTALGVLGSALPVNGRVRPLGVSDKYAFGASVCGIGPYVGFLGDAYWLYRVNRRTPEVAADKQRLRAGADVLWYFSDTAANVNTGDELVVGAPVRATVGVPFNVTVRAYDETGNARPAAGATVTGDTVSTTGADGRTTVLVDRPRTVSLRATRGPDIASRPISVCVGPADGCPARRGERIVGRGRSDAIVGTSGDDDIRARGGDDRIRTHRGGRDVVDCGTGTDLLVRDRRDRAQRSCERVVTRR